jgi:hypothetical protein
MNTTSGGDGVLDVYMIHINENNFLSVKYDKYW